MIVEIQGEMHNPITVQGDRKSFLVTRSHDCRVVLDNGFGHGNGEQHVEMFNLTIAFGGKKEEFVIGKCKLCEKVQWAPVIRVP